jgi:hypothetical protein
VTQEKVVKRFAGKETAELMRAFHNPDHSAAAIRALTALLHDRGVSDQEIEAFRCNPEELLVPSFGRNPSLQEALRRPRRWWAVYRSIQVVALILLGVGVIALNREEKERQSTVDELIAQGRIDRAEYVDATRSVPEFARDDFNKQLLKELGESNGTEAFSSSPLSGAAAVAGFILFFWVRPLAWRSPARILLLRPFGEKQVSRSLKRLVRRNVIFSGHVLTLADRHMKE